MSKILDALEMVVVEVFEMSFFFFYPSRIIYNVL